MRAEKVIEQPVKLDTLTRRYTEEAVKFLRESTGTPFSLYFPHTFLHIPLAAQSAEFRGKSPHGIYGDVLAELDWSVGQVMEALRETGALADTLVLFSSDNGPWYQGQPGPVARTQRRNVGRWRSRAIHCVDAGRIPPGRVSSAVGSMLDRREAVRSDCSRKEHRRAGCLAAVDGRSEPDRSRASARFRRCPSVVRTVGPVEDPCFAL